MDFKSTTGKSIGDAFKEFDEKNPKVYKLFKRYVYRAIDRGKEKVSSKMIINLIRWEYYLDTDSDDGFKINDAFTAHYSRKFSEEYPQQRHMFSFRRLRSTGSTIEEASQIDEDVIQSNTNPVTTTEPTYRAPKTGPAKQNSMYSHDDF